MAIENELRVVLLLCVVWLMEVACTRINVSPIIGQIAGGLVVGPALLDLIPHAEAFKLLGKLGVMILVVESGLAVDIQDVRQFGARASLAAATGVLLPTVLSFALYSGVLGAGWKAAFAVGAALSPTSLGFSAQLLGEVGQLTTPIGQLICTAAVIDDVLSLLLLAEVQALGDENPEWHDYAVPVLASVGSVSVGGLAAVYISSKAEPLGVWLSYLNKKNSSNDNGRLSSSPARRAEVATGTARQGEQDFSPSVYRSPPVADEPAAAADLGQTLVDTTTVPLEPGVFSTPAAVAVSPTLYGGDAGRQGDAGSVRRGDRALLTMVLAFSLVFAYLSSLVGTSDLLGCFLGGLAFSGVPGIQTIWARQMKRYSRWGARLFFSATVAFSVPSVYKDGGLLRVKPFWKGLILTVAAIVGKLVVGFYAGPPLTLSGFLKLGWAMNGRGEFSFFIAQEASDEGILTTEDYSAVVWALLLSSIAAPVFFRRVLAKDNDDVNDAHSNHRRKKNGEEELAGGGSTTAVR
ncbi:unnamed protein product [Ectocarpus sp. 12 AP-2014]